MSAPEGGKNGVAVTSVSRRREKIRHAPPSRTHRIIGSRESTRGEECAEGGSLKLQALPIPPLPSAPILPLRFQLFCYIFKTSRSRPAGQRAREEEVTARFLPEYFAEPLESSMGERDRCVEGTWVRTNISAFLSKNLAKSDDFDFS